MEFAELKRGVQVAGRFTVEAQVGWGIKGTLLRARDGQTGRLVALRVWPAKPETAEQGRMEREMEALRALAHPGLAMPLGYGRLEQGQWFLATEWVEGESLRRRLARQPLTAGESVQLVGHVAASLGQAHRLGVVHRGLTPSSLLLEGGEIGRVQVLDFGMQSPGLSSQTISQSGEVMGAVRYMAPEQAWGDKECGPSVDVFALGCLLFECLTGQPLFQGRQAAEVIERVLYQEAPALERLRPGLPPSLEQLLARMLAKAPRERPTDGEALARELAAVRLSAAQAVLVPLVASEGARDAPAVLGSEEQRLVCMVRTAPVSLRDDEAFAELQRLVAAHGAQLERLEDGALQATVEGHGQTAMDQAGQAARAALALGQRLGELPLVVMTRRTGAEAGQEPGAGGVDGVDGIGGWVLEHLQAKPHSSARAGVVRLDELTGALVERRFHVRREQGALVLEGERDEDRGMLLGRPTPYVGREQELRTLEMLYAACAEGEVAKGALVLAASGMGKSRLRREFLERVERQGAEVLLGRGDLIRMGTAYGLIRQAVLRLCGLEEAADSEVRQQRLAERVGRSVETGQRQRVVAFLGELCGVPLPDEYSPRLRAARQDPQLMRAEVRAAWLDFLRAECGARLETGTGAVVLVLEDVHWSDGATVGLVEGMLGELAEQPLMLLALGRPETKELFPRLWEKECLQEIRLGGLGRKASERLVREMLQARATEDTVRRIVEQAGGHALFLEELIRAEAEGEGTQLPATMMAMLQARFQRLEPGARRVLRAASVFGERFWAGGVRELLGGEAVEVGEFERWLEGLRRGEIVVREGESRYAGEVQYSFRHGLLREAADGLLEAADRRRGHGFVARYLERQGEQDAAVLAEHYRQAEEQEKAAGWYARAAERAFESGDSQTALNLARLGVGCGAQGEALGRLRAVEAWTLIWTSGDLVGAYAASSAAVQLLRPGSIEWYEAIGPVRHCASILTREELARYVRTLAEVKPEPGAESASVESAMGMVMAGSLYGAPEMARAFLGRLEETCARLGEGDARAQGLLWTGTLWYRYAAESDVWGYWVAARKAVAAFEVAGHRRYWGLCRWHLGCGYVLLGDLAAARRAWQSVQEQFEQFGEFTIVRSLWALSALVLAATGEPELHEEALRQAERALVGPPLPASWSQLALVVQAELLLERGAMAVAEERARQANEVSVQAFDPLARAVLGRVLLAQGQAEAARKKVEEGLAKLAALGGMSLMDIKLHLVAAEVRQALGDPVGARQALEDAERKIRLRAEQIEDPVMRERFLVGLRDHARARALLQARASHS